MNQLFNVLPHGELAAALRADWRSLLTGGEAAGAVLLGSAVDEVVSGCGFSEVGERDSSWMWSYAMSILAGGGCYGGIGGVGSIWWNDCAAWLLELGAARACEAIPGEARDEASGRVFGFGNV